MILTHLRWKIFRTATTQQNLRSWSNGNLVLSCCWCHSSGEKVYTKNLTYQVQIRLILLLTFLLKFLSRIKHLFLSKIEYSKFFKYLQHTSFSRLSLSTFLKTFVFKKFLLQIFTLFSFEHSKSLEYIKQK